MPIREEDRLIEIMRDEHDGDVDLAPDFQQMRLHAGACLRVECAEGLVHQQNTRLIGERAHNRHPLLHAARQLMRIRFGEFFEPDQLQPLQCLRLGFVVALAVDLEAEHHVLLHGQPREQRITLEHHPAITARLGHRLALQ